MKDERMNENRQNRMTYIYDMLSITTTNTPFSFYLLKSEKSNQLTVLCTVVTAVKVQMNPPPKIKKKRNCKYIDRQTYSVYQ